MTQARQQAAHASGSADDTEAAFYEALQNANLEKLMACWADEDEVVCVHPGGARMVGVTAVRSGFEAIFANGNVQAWPQRVRKVESLTTAVHSVLERVAVTTPQGPRTAYVIATNVYLKTAQGWRMVAHHASPGTPAEVQEISEGTQVLH
ncbi:MAG: nuclear transport factor 2 family protein [Burkholderiaceae bacterium]|nr:nuclear transport factor 2 family protein [Burkholderiaceae bacterium]